MYLSGFLNERLIFYELFCQGPSALHKYALMAVRGLIATLKSLQIQYEQKFGGEILNQFTSMKLCMEG